MNADRRVLVIDDEMGPRESLRILLQSEFDVDCAESVLRGLELLQEKRPDAVIMDIRMPGMDGIGGLAAIRKLDTHVSVIMLTAFSELETARSAIRLGANDYLEKPFDTREMLDIVRRNVERSRMKRQREQIADDLLEINKQLQHELTQKENIVNLGRASSELFHDFANEMMGIHAQVESLARSLRSREAEVGGNQKETSENFQSLQKTVRRCWDLIGMWQNRKKTSAGNEEIAVPEVLEEVIKANAAMAESLGASVQLHKSTGPCVVRGDRTQLYRAFNNIVVNGLQALPPEGGRIQVSADAKPHEVEVKIVDNGCGIAPDRIHEIFKPFVTTKSTKGSGLGLCITKKFVEAHKGTIAVESQPGVGTAFTVRIPIGSPAS